MKENRKRCCHQTYELSCTPAAEPLPALDPNWSDTDQWDSWFLMGEMLHIGLKVTGSTLVS